MQYGEHWRLHYRARHKGELWTPGAEQAALHKQGQTLLHHLPRVPAPTRRGAKKGWTDPGLRWYYARSRPAGYATLIPLMNHTK